MRFPSQSSLHRVAAATTVFSHSPVVVMSTRPSFHGRGGGRGYRNFAGEFHSHPTHDANFNFKHNYNAQSYNYCTHENNQNNYTASGRGGGGNFGGRGAPPHSRWQNQAADGVRRQKPADFRTWEFAKQPPPPNSERFVVLSYNILADYLANGHRNLYFHIPRQFMSWEWRKSNILFELKLWSPDIMCLQEVDKFQELEEDLRGRGYSGIWKMRTGEPVDGCAIFFRTRRFKLMFEDRIEYNKHGMRDNVAQVCVLEALNQNHRGDQLSSSSSGVPNRVVVCNIHVLYNPRRGEMKLGQVRMLLEKAHAVSKTWDDAPIVLCGDFNCTPKSALYNFIAEKKLDISQVDRDNVSGQASAEIRPPSRSYGYNFRGQLAGNMANSTMTPSPNNISETDNFNSQSDNSCSTSDPKFVEESMVDRASGLPSQPAGDLNTSNFGDAVFNADIATKNKPLYNPSMWTAMEKATATGNTNITILEHPLKLRSTYSEVVDSSGTRDPCGEPLVTSYNSCFMGTVDYIWRSEGLQTVKVLAPIQKDVMQPSGGFPTKKWGSDHIALASELAFTR
ncbi:hypothetical protein RND81_10G085300 [Saponaria officinalis]|uniref:Endonuclease/exonuclease/phosphatase domain-containing protein n=2 Tax=Saponaria officinalis TaxID=3572 RepID=A0AAW1I1Y4_SAPOF